MRGLATSGGVVVPSFDRAARTGHTVSGGGGGGGRGGVAFFRRFFTTAVINTAMDITRSDVLGKSAQTTSSDGQEGSEDPLGSEAIVAQRAATARQDVLASVALAAERTQRPTRLRRVQRRQATKSACWLVSYTASGRAVKRVICGTGGSTIWHWSLLVAHSTREKQMLLKGWLLLSSVLLPGCTCLLAPSLNARRGINAASGTGDDVSDAIDLINQCATDRSAKPDDAPRRSGGAPKAHGHRRVSRSPARGTCRNDKLAAARRQWIHAESRTLAWDLTSAWTRKETLPFLEIKIRGENPYGWARQRVRIRPPAGSAHAMTALFAPSLPPGLNVINF